MMRGREGLERNLHNHSLKQTIKKYFGMSTAAECRCTQLPFC
jgi:hypothetical protein